MATGGRIGKRDVDNAIRRARSQERELTLQDATLPGFHARVQPTGVVTYAYRYQLRGNRCRITVGRHGVWTTATARERAGVLAKMVDDGIDPKAEAQRKASAPTMARLCEEYMERHAKLHKLSFDKDQQRIDRYVVPALGRVMVADLTRARVRELLAEIGAKQGKEGTANKVRALLSTMMSLALEWGYRIDNPCAGLGKSVKKGGAAYPTKQVHRYLSADEVRIIFGEVDKIQDRVAAVAIRFILLTGCRHQEALKLRWSDIEFEGRRLSLTTKTGEQIRAVSDQAVASLQDLRRPEVGDAPVFPSPRSPTRKRASLDWQWRKVLDAAKVGRVRLHDLRHTAASLAAANGASLSQIGAMLGHRSAQATYMYAHLVDADIRAVASGVAVSIEKAIAAAPKVRSLAPATSKKRTDGSRSTGRGRGRRT